MEDLESLDENKSESGMNLAPITSQLVIVRPQQSDNAVKEEAPDEDVPELNNNIKNHIKAQRESSSSYDSIEEVDISKGTLSVRPRSWHQITESNHNKEKPRDSVKVTSMGKKKEKKNKKKSPERTILANVFNEELILSDVIYNPTPEIHIIDLKTDMQRFLLTPLPKNVLARCQVNKTNTIDKTLLFTNFIFSLQISDTDSNVNKNVQTLMVAHPNRNPKKFTYTISSDISDVKSNSSSIVGKVKSNFLGTRFNIFSKNTASVSNNDENTNDSDDDDSNSNPMINSGFDHIGVIFYKHSGFGSKKPRKIDLFIPLWNEEKETYETNTNLPKERNDAVTSDRKDITRLKNLKPHYDEERKCLTMEFGGRATVSSIKNFALMMKVGEDMKRVYQFGKCKSHFIVDFSYPLCAVQAFAIALSCCQRKIASD